MEDFKVLSEILDDETPPHVVHEIVVNSVNIH